MFPIAHAWLLEQLIPAPTPAHYLGCVWPDMIFGGPLTHLQSHRSGAQLAAYAHTLGEGDAATFRAFAVGVLTHGSEPRGFDWYSDEQYSDQPQEARGYAFQHGLSFASEAARACGVAEQQGWWKAHNIVEMAFEPILYSQQPSLGERLLAIHDNMALIQTVTTHLAPFFSLPAADLAQPIYRFFEVTQLRPTSPAALAPAYAMQTRLKHPGAQPSEAAIAALIARAQDAIAADCDSYLNVCVERVGDMLRAII